MSMSVKLDGLEEFEKALAELAKSTSRGVLERSLRKAAAPMLARAKQYAPSNSGDLEASLAIGRNVKGDPGKAAFARVMRSGGTRAEARGALLSAQRDAGISFAQLYLGPRLGKGGGSHAHLVELGTGPRYQKETGKFVGEMPPDPFLRPAFDSEAKPTIDRLKPILWDEIDKTAKRVAARAARKKG